MELQDLLKKHEKIKKDIKETFQCYDEVKAFLDFDDLEIVFVIKPPIPKKVLNVAKNVAEVNQFGEIVFRGNGLFATQVIRNKINQFIEELEKI